MKARMIGMLIVGARGPGYEIIKCVNRSDKTVRIPGSGNLRR